MSDSSDGSEKLLYFIIGGFIGAAFGMLFAPKTGEETRAFLSNRARDGADYVTSRREALEKQASSALEQGKEALTRQRESINAAIEAGKQAYKEEQKRPES